MDFDRWTILLLERRDDAPRLNGAESAALQDAHLAYLARLHEEGHLLAAGPVQGSAGSPVAGVCIYRDRAEEARALAERDPAAKAGVFRVELFSWQVPEGTIRFEPVRFPHSMAQAEEK
jgi:hypothetical protein